MSEAQNIGPAKYRKKPVEIEALQLTQKTVSFIALKWLPTGVLGPGWGVSPPTVLIRTLEGTMTAKDGDWIIKGVKGEFYPVKPDIFEATYEVV